jgi:eukaryotic-like serine/threonine-protein kinase
VAREQPGDQSPTRMEELFHAALEQPPEDRREFLMRAVPDEPALRAEVESLLKAAAAEDFLGTSPFPTVVEHPQTLKPGTRLGSFEITGLLGRGGMGEVYRAYDPRLQRDIAIKVLPALFAADRAHVSRFEREARAASALNHPNIVSIFDIGHENGVYWIVSELIDGESLRDQMARGTIEQRRALSIATQVANALAAAHAAGLVHRDLKPANIILHRDGRAKLVDFGLAKQTGPFEGGTLTESGTVLGTAGYMAPEQVRGELTDLRADVFSLGVVLYELFSGKQAFTGASTVERMHAVLKEEPPALPATVPRALDRLVRRCLEKDPNRRFQSAMDLAFALESSLAIPPARSVSRMAGRRSATWIAFGAVTAVTAFAAAILILSRVRDVRFIERLAYEVEPLTLVGDVDEATISPDGKLLAYTSGLPDRLSLRIKTLATGEDRELPGARRGPMHGLAFSFDSKQIYVGFDGVTSQLPVAGGVPVELLTQRKIGYAAPSPNGAEMVFVPYIPSNFGIYLAHPDGGDERLLIQYRFPKLLYGPTWSPRGDAIAFVGTPSGFFHWDVMTIAAHPGAAPRIVSPRHFYRLGRAEWVNGGKAFVFAGVETPGKDPLAQLWTMTYHGGELRRITNGLDSYSTVSSSSDSQLLGAVREQTTSEILLLSQEGSLIRHLTTRGPAREGTDGVVFLGDERLVFTSKLSGTGELWSIDTDGANRRRLTDNGARNMWPFVSNSGQTILWARVDQAAGTWAMDADGSNVRRISSLGGWFWSETGSAPESLTQPRTGRLPDGTFIPYASTLDSGERSLMRAETDGSLKSIVLSKLPMSPVQPAVSPDKRWIAFGVETEGAPQTAVIPATGGDPVAVLPINAWSVHWTPDGKSLIYIRNDEGSDNLWTAPVFGGQARQMTRFNDVGILRFASSVTGKYLAVVHGSTSKDAVLLRAKRQP